MNLREKKTEITTLTLVELDEIGVWKNFQQGLLPQFASGNAIFMAGHLRFEKFQFRLRKAEALSRNCYDSISNIYL
jgi:hypothetical protein